MDLALEIGVSPRHLSFVETGRSRPSPELVLAIATHLDVPLRERNTLLLAAGYAPRYSQSSFDDPSMVHARASLQRMLDAHDPYPGVVVDRSWNVVLANNAAALLTAGLPDELLVLAAERLPGEPASRRTRRAHIERRRMGTAVVPTAATVGGADRRPGARDVARRGRELSDGRHVARRVRDDRVGRTAAADPDATHGRRHELSLFTTITTFGTPRDVTLDELALELFFPADADTERTLRGARELVGVTAADDDAAPTEIFTR